MGYIYKATCLNNNKIYIGLTNVGIIERWKEHLYASFTPFHKDYELAFHRAIRKHGAENFQLEEIDQGIGQELKDKEKYWINFYDSYNNGYNETLGGDGQCKYDYDKIVDFYMSNGYSLIKTCQQFGVYDQVVYSALKSKNIDYKKYSGELKNKNRQKHTSKILMVEENKIFNTMAEIDLYFGKQVHGNIRRCLNGLTKKAYGYTWKEVDE